MMMLERYGMASAIVDAFDEDLKNLPRGTTDLRNWFLPCYDGEEINLKSVGKEEAIM